MNIKGVIEKIMIDNDIVNIAGIEEDGTVTCKSSMAEDAWANLEKDKIISVSEVEKGKRIYYCDYYERGL